MMELQTEFGKRGWAGEGVAASSVDKTVPLLLPLATDVLHAAVHLPGACMSNREKDVDIDDVPSSTLEPSSSVIFLSLSLHCNCLSSLSFLS